jgi:predicted porin
VEPHPGKGLRYLMRNPLRGRIPQNQTTAYGDSSRAGQWFNGQGCVRVSSPTYGTLTVFRQNALTLDADFDYDPFAASYAFSPIGFQGATYGGGNTKN